MDMFKKLKPIFVERSFIPRLLSTIAPINIGAITLGFIVFSRDVMSDTTKRHETIHFQQYLETFFIGFLLLYLYDFLKARASGLSGHDAYRQIRAEKEAYNNQDTISYLSTRPRYVWIFESKESKLQ
jgi:hypothetical protein